MLHHLRHYSTEGQIKVLWFYCRAVSQNCRIIVHYGKSFGALNKSSRPGWRRLKHGGVNTRFCALPPPRHYSPLRGPPVLHPAQDIEPAGGSGSRNPAPPPPSCDAMPEAAPRHDNSGNGCSLSAHLHGWALLLGNRMPRRGRLLNACDQPFHRSTTLHVQEIGNLSSPLDSRRPTLDAEVRRLRP